MSYRQQFSPSRVLRLFAPLVILLIACGTQSLEEQLREAARSPSTGTLERVKELIAKGAKVDASDDRGDTAISEAVNWGRVEVVKVLLNAGANVKHKDRYGNTLLHEAVQGAKLLSKDGKPITGDGSYEDTVKLLIASGVDVNAVNDSDETALSELVGEKYMTIDEQADAMTITRLVKILLEGGAAPSAGGKSVMHVAAMQGQTGAVQALLETRKVNVNGLNANGETPLMLALEYGRMETARLLVSNGADVSLRDKEGRTALMIAVDKGDAPLVEMILQMGANPNQSSTAGKPVLHQAIAKGSADIVKVLLAKGADPNGKDANGMTALKNALWAGRNEIADMLRAAGATE